MTFWFGSPYTDSYSSGRRLLLEASVIDPDGTIEEIPLTEHEEDSDGRLDQPEGAD